MELVRDTGIEPVTSSVSGKRSPAELIALSLTNEVEMGIEAVQSSHKTPGHPAFCDPSVRTGYTHSAPISRATWSSSSGYRCP
jgi:hypothetical protein